MHMSSVFVALCQRKPTENKLLCLRDYDGLLQSLAFDLHTEHIEKCVWKQTIRKAVGSILSQRQSQSRYAYSFVRKLNVYMRNLIELESKKKSKVTKPDDSVMHWVSLCNHK